MLFSGNFGEANFDKLEKSRFNIEITSANQTLKSKICTRKDNTFNLHAERKFVHGKKKYCELQARLQVFSLQSMQAAL